MTTQATKEKRINASQKRIDALHEKRTKLNDRIEEVNADLKREQEHLSWVKQMPVAPEEEAPQDGEEVF